MGRSVDVVWGDRNGSPERGWPHSYINYTWETPHCVLGSGKEPYASAILDRMGTRRSFPYPRYGTLNPVIRTALFGEI